MGHYSFIFLFICPIPLSSCFCTENNNFFGESEKKCTLLFGRHPLERIPPPKKRCRFFCRNSKSHTGTITMTGTIIRSQSFLFFALTLLMDSKQIKIRKEKRNDLHFLDACTFRSKRDPFSGALTHALHSDTLLSIISRIYTPVRAFSELAKKIKSLIRTFEHVISKL